MAGSHCDNEQVCTRCPFARLLSSRYSGPLFMGLLAASAGIYYLPGSWSLVSLAVALAFAFGLFAIILINPKPRTENQNSTV